MADRMILVGPDDILGSNLVHPQMVKDLVGVASIDVEYLNSLSAILLQTEGILNEESLAEIVSEFILDEDQALATVSVLQNLRPNVVDQALAMIQTWRDSSQSNRTRFPDEAFTALQEKLPAIVQDYPAISRMRKASRLQGVLGNELEKVEFICDARPVFDEEREQIEGLLPLTTLKILYERQNGMTEEFEVFLSSSQLDDLVTKAQKAQQKVSVLDKVFPLWLNTINDH